MGATSTYVFSASDHPGFAERTLHALKAADIIEADGDNKMFYPGSSTALGANFDYLGVHCSRLPFIIPQDPAVTPHCSKCNADVSEIFYATVNEIEDEGETIDWRSVTVHCPRCDCSNELPLLKDKVGIFFAREYLYFSDVDAENITSFEDRLRKLLGEVEIKSYWYT